MLQTLIGLYRTAIDSIKRAEILQMAEKWLSKDAYNDFLRMVNTK